MVITADAVVRFWRYVDRPVAPESACWTWTGSRTRKGYGRFSANRKNVFPHRFSYALHMGGLPPGMCVLHRCDNPACVRPDHLFLGTRADNNADCKAKGRYRPLKGGWHDANKRPLTDDQVIQIRRLHREGFTYRQLGSMFPVSESSIGRLVRRVSYTHI